MNTSLIRNHPSQQALDFAIDVFPELAHIPRDRLSICVNGHIGRQAGHIRVAPMAWGAVVPKLSSFEILDVVVQPTPPKGADPVVDVKNGLHAHSDEPPKYEEKKSDGSSSGVGLGTQRDGSSQGCPGLRPSASSSSMPAWAKGLFGKRAA